jgi:hypothetical protein
MGLTDQNKPTWFFLKGFVMFKKALKWALLPAVAAVVVACGGGGGSLIGGAAPTLTGVAAVGAPMGGAFIVLKDKNGKEWTTTADNNGAFEFGDLTGAAAPLQLIATVKLGDTIVTHYALIRISHSTARAAV